MMMTWLDVCIACVHNMIIFPNLSKWPLNIIVFLVVEALLPMNNALFSVIFYSTQKGCHPVNLCIIKGLSIIAVSCQAIRSEDRKSLLTKMNLFSKSSPWYPTNLWIVKGLPIRLSPTKWPGILFKNLKALLITLFFLSNHDAQDHRCYE